MNNYGYIYKTSCAAVNNHIIRGNNLNTLNKRR